MTTSSREFNPRRVAEALWRSAVLKTFQQRGMLRGNGRPVATAVVYGGRIVYRTTKSKYIGDTEYKPGHTYIAPILSFSAETPCHPGIYAGTLGQIKKQYPHEQQYVRCYVRDGDWVICEKGIRCARLRVLSYVDTNGKVINGQ